MRILAPVLFVGVVGLGIFASYQYNYGTLDTVTTQVVKTERVVTKDSSKYLIFTDREVFENTDSVMHWKFNSSDLYGKINEGDKCTFTVNGVRLPLFSTYRNILEIKECAANG